MPLKQLLRPPGYSSENNPKNEQNLDNCKASENFRKNNSNTLSLTFECVCLCEKNSPLEVIIKSFEKVEPNSIETFNTQDT